MGVLEGWARKAALPLLIISAAGWIVYMVGFCLFYYEFSAAPVPTTATTATNLYQQLYFTPNWMFLGSGILMYILGILYLLFGNSFLGLATNFFTSISLATGGMILLYGSIIIFGLNVSVSSNNTLMYFITSVAGCLVAEVFLGFSMLLWPFFIVNQPECCINLTEEDRRAFSGRHSRHYQPESSSPQAVPMVPMATVPGYTSAAGFKVPNPQGPQQY